MSYRLSLLLLLLFAIAGGINAQNRRVVTYHSTNFNNIVIDVSAFIYETVDIQPRFPGGERELMKYINKERKYPKEAYNEGIEGRVVCGFIVSPKGEIINAEILRGVEESLNKEALRVISNMPQWEPGLVEGEKVPVYCILPIVFRR